MNYLTTYIDLRVEGGGGTVVRTRRKLKSRDVANFQYGKSNTVKSQKQASNYYKPVSSISRYFLKKRYPTLL